MRPLLFAFGLVSCVAPLPAPAPEASARPAEGDLAAAVIEVPEGAGPLSACTPTGVEICFNATDDNCNGVIDEGCGVHTGLLQFAIAWERGPDVDLLVTCPKGELARSGGATTSGLRKDRDCGTSRDLCHGQNLENVYLEEGRPPVKGRYLVEVKLERASEGDLPVSVRLGARIGARTYAMDLDLAKKGDSRVFAFTL